MTKFKDLYRGLTLPPSVIKQYKGKKGGKFFMGGFTSASLNLEEAINYAFKNNDDENVPVLMHIQWRDMNRYLAFRLDKKQYSSMP